MKLRYKTRRRDEFGRFFHFFFFSERQSLDKGGYVHACKHFLADEEKKKRFFINSITGRVVETNFSSDIINPSRIYYYTSEDC